MHKIEFPRNYKNFNFSLFRYTLIGIITGDCVSHSDDDDGPPSPGIYTSFFSDNIWSWVQTTVASQSDGLTGQLGTAVGRVEFSSCREHNALEPAYLSDGQAVSYDLHYKIDLTKCKVCKLSVIG